MNTPFIFPSGSLGSRRGMALILVLAGIILVAGLLVTLVFITKSGRVVSGAYAGQVQTRVLANSALNLVIGQIQDATDLPMTESWASQPGAIRVYGNTSTTGDNFLEGYKLFSSSVMTVTPTTSLGSATGEAALVSDAEGDGNPVPLNWATEIGQYVNLNQPVYVNGTPVYPIVDPAVLPTQTGSLATPNPVAGNTATETAGVQGFSDTDSAISGTNPNSGTYPNLAMPVEWLYQLQDGTFVPGVYSNGTVTVGGTIRGTAYEAPTSANPIVARVAFWTDDETSKVNVNTASEGVYWDEPRVNTQDVPSDITTNADKGRPGSPSSTSLVQIDPDYAANPAALTTPSSENIDPNVANTAPNGQSCSNLFPAIGTDQGYAANQPAQNEFNRFPGHPATTSLSAVFSELSPVQIFSILPRYSLNGVASTHSFSGKVLPANYTSYPTTLPDGGSVFGVLPWIYYACFGTPGYGDDVDPANGGYDSAVSLNTNHLYDSAGEVMFQPNRSLNGPGGMNTTATTSTPLTPAMVEQRKFFLTAESRAPELNLFGCPRVSMWPVYWAYNPKAGTVAATALPPTSQSSNPTSKSWDYNGTTHLEYPYCTAYDKMAAFCSTLQPSGTTTTYPFYFERENAYDPSIDLNITDISGNKVNTNLFNYLHAMTNQAIPGFGGNFQAKYTGANGDDADQILTEALDYIRCTNLYDGSLEYDVNGQPAQWLLDEGKVFTEWTSAGNEFTEGQRNYTNVGGFELMGYPGYGQVVPLQNGNYMGLGRTYTVSQVALQFICTGDYAEGNPNGTPPAPSALSSNTTYNLTLPALNTDNNPGPNPLINQSPGHGKPNNWQKQIQAILLVELATPMQGYPALCPSIAATITQGGTGVFGVTGTSSQPTSTTSAGSNLFPTTGPLYTYDNAVTKNSTYAWVSSSNAYDSNAPYREGANPAPAVLWNGIGACGYGSIFPFVAMGYDPNPVPAGQTPLSPTAPDQQALPIQTTFMNITPGYTNIPLYPYVFISQPFTVKVTSETDTMTVTWPTDLKIQLSYAPDGNQVAAAVPYQTIDIDFADAMGGATTTIPVPNLVQGNPSKWVFAQYGIAGGSDNTVTGVVTNNAYNGGSAYAGRLAIMSSPAQTGMGTKVLQEFVQDQTNTSISNPPFGGNTDVVRAMAVVDGDFRLNAAMKSVPTTRFAAVGGAAALNDTTTYCYQTLTSPYVSTLAWPPVAAGAEPLVSYQVDVSNPSIDATSGLRANEGSYIAAGATTMPAFCNPEIPSTVSPLLVPSYANTNAPYLTGDWDNGLAGMPDGPFANMADIGTTNTWYNNGTSPSSYPTIPYFDCPAQEQGGRLTSFSPNRQIPSPGMFGSLPTGVMAKNPWQTLRFRPQSNSAGPDFTPDYSTSIPDYLFMDLFWMPVVQPYAISEPFSTAGKINMNYQILPFTYIKRQTGLYAILKNERMLCIPSSAASSTTGQQYKGNGTAPMTGAVQTSDATAWRHTINVAATLQQFDNVFASNQIFRSPAQICDQYLVPNDSLTTATLPTVGTAAATFTSDMQSYWSGELLTGDNTRERPYTVIYPRLTTQSNTYRVHYWVQSLRKARGSTPNVFVDPNSTAAANGMQPDSIRGQLRGSFLIERYLQSDDSRLATWASSNYPTPTSNLDPYYKIRILGSTDFNPQ